MALILVSLWMLSKSNQIGSGILWLMFYLGFIFVFLLFLGMVMYANEVETKEK